MKKALKILAALPALLFIVFGLRWMIAPEGMAKELGMPLLEGMGLSSQLGDVGSFFLGGGIMVMIGIITERRDWLYAATLLVAGAAVFRTVAWLAHGAPFAVTSIAVEVTITVILIATAAQFKPTQK
jgi:hypothetical protein